MSTIKISDLTSSGAVLGNVIVPVVGNVAGTWTTLKSTVDQLKTFIVASAEANILAANAATIFANVNMKSYVDGQLTAANAGVASANIGIIGYIGLGNTIQSQQIAAANVGIIGYIDQGNTIQSAQITAANVGMIGYVNNSVTTANTGVVGYVILANTNMKTYADGQITAANAGATSANVGMKGYVDNQTYSNVQVATYLPTFSGNVALIGATNALIAYGNLYVGNTYVPTTAGSEGVAGQTVWDSDYVYICVATNTWKRANIATW